MFFVVVLAVNLLMLSYVVWRGWQVFELFPKLRLTYVVFNVLGFAIMLFNFMVRDALPDKIAHMVAFIGYSYIIVLIYLVLSFLFVDMVRLINAIFHITSTSLLQFRFWALVTSVGLIVLAMLVGNYKFNNPQVRHLELTAHKPSQNKSLRIVVASDLHLGVAINRDDLAKFVDLINKQKPDIVFLPGDIADNITAPIIKQKMGEEFNRIQAIHGVFVISGNHEYFGEHPKGLENYFTPYGIQYLRDTAVLVDSSFYVVGRDDRLNKNRKKLDAILKGIDSSSKPIFLLDHQPFHLNEAVANKVDLQVSGHTHNGQFFPGNLIVKQMYELPYGYLKKENTHFYVTSGLGIWGPQYRIGTVSELVVIDFNY